MKEPRYLGREITWREVERLLREVAKAHCCNIFVHLSPPATEGTAVVLWVQVRAEPRLVGRRTIRAPVAKSHRFPTGEAATVEALVFRLLYDLDRTLDELGHIPAEQADFGWG
jgi:hypothetical protein